MFDTLKALFGWPWFPRKPKPPVPPPQPLPEKETDLAYGPDPLQKLDVYRPPNTMPGDKLRAILMVHGGGWDNPDGDKANPGVIANKAAYYVPKGIIVVSMNYRLFTPTNGITPLQEQQDVAAAYAFVQKLPGVDPARVGLMGHSAGGTNVAVAGASMVKPAWIVCLDAGTLDVQDSVAKAAKLGSDLMVPFGTDESKWPAMSPIDNVQDYTGPWLLAVGNRSPASVKQTEAFASRVQQFDGSATVQQFDLSHGDMDAMVGLPGPLTDAVDKFIGA
jgi:acetyl esterase/lipase